MDIIDRINLMLAEKGMNGAELSRKIGVSNSVYSQWNTRATSPSKKSIAKIAKALGTSVEYLMGFSDQKESPLTVSGEGTTIDVSDLSAANQEKVKEYIALLLNAQRTEQP